MKKSRKTKAKRMTIWVWCQDGKVFERHILTEKPPPEAMYSLKIDQYLYDANGSHVKKYFGWVKFNGTLT